MDRCTGNAHVNVSRGEKRSAKIDFTCALHVERSRPIRVRVRLWLRKRALFERLRASRAILREHAGHRERITRAWLVKRRAWERAQMQPIVEVAPLVGLRWQGREGLYHADAEQLIERDARLIDALDGLPGDSIEVAIARAKHARVVWTKMPVVPGTQWGELQDRFVPPRFQIVRPPQTNLAPELHALVEQTYRLLPTLSEEAHGALDRENEQDGRWWLDDDEYPVRALAAFERRLPDGYTVDGLHVGHP